MEAAVAGAGLVLVEAVVRLRGPGPCLPGALRSSGGCNPAHVADAAAGECEPAQTTSALRASAAEATDTVEPSVLRRMRRQLSALHGFDEGVTRPAKEGPGRLFSRKVSAAVAAAPTGASTASVDAMAPQPLGALEA